MAAIGAGITAILSAGGIGAALLKAGFSLLLNYAISKIFPPKGPKPSDVQSEIRQSNASRTRHYGLNRVSGVVHFWDWTTVDGKRTLFKLLAIATGGVTAFNKFWLNDVEVAVDEAADGAVTTEPYDGPVRLRYRLGLPDDQRQGGYYTRLHDAFPSNWIAGVHKLNDVATILGQFEAVKSEDISDVYSGGEPKMTALISGAACYDPRGGSNVSANTSYTANPTLHLLDLFAGSAFGRLKLTDMILGDWEACADDCDDQIALKSGGTIARYFGGGTYELKEPLKDVARRILDSFGGKLYWGTNGKLGVRSGKWRVPTYTIEEQHIVSTTGGALSGDFDRVSTLVPRFVSPDLDYQETTADAWDDPATLALIGETEPKEFDLMWVQHHGQARRLSKQQIAKLNPKWRFTLRLRFWGLLLIEEETVYVNVPRLGIINEPFWIDKFGFDLDGGDGVCTVGLTHARPESFVWDAATEEGEPPTVPEDVDKDEEQSTQQDVIDALINLSVATRFFNSTTKGAVITASADVRSGYYLVFDYRPQSGGAWFAMNVDQNTGEATTSVLDDSTEYMVRYGYSTSRTANSGTVYATIQNVSVQVTNAAPEDPLLVSAVSNGGNVDITFAPDLGADYWRTLVYRGTTFGSAGVVATLYANSSQVDVSVAEVSGDKYWLQSENYNSDTSGAVLAFTA